MGEDGRRGEPRRKVGQYICHHRISAIFANVSARPSLPSSRSRVLVESLHFPAVIGQIPVPGCVLPNSGPAGPGLPDSVKSEYRKPKLLSVRERPGSCWSVPSILVQHLLQAAMWSVTRCRRCPPALLTHARKCLTSYVTGGPRVVVRRRDDLLGHCAGCVRLTRRRAHAHAWNGYFERRKEPQVRISFQQNQPLRSHD